MFKESKLKLILFEKRKGHFFLIPCSFHKLLFLHFFKFLLSVYLLQLSETAFSYAAMKRQSQHCLTSKLKSFLKNGWQLSKKLLLHKFVFFINFTFSNIVLLISFKVFLCLTLQCVQIVCLYWRVHC